MKAEVNEGELVGGFLSGEGGNYRRETVVVAFSICLSMQKRPPPSPAFPSLLILLLEKSLALPAGPARGLASPPSPHLLLKRDPLSDTWSLPFMSSPHKEATRKDTERWGGGEKRGSAAK